MANVYVVGTRGIPNRYGGFERLVEVLAPYLASRGHQVTVFCQADSGSGAPPGDDYWNGVRRRYVRPSARGGLGTLQYDFDSFRQVESGAIALVFGYGTAVLQAVLKARGVRHCVNMDGIEWKRAKWSAPVKWWLKINERAAATLADVLIADHPEIQEYLRARFARESRMIAYGVDVLAEDSLEHRHPVVERYAGESYFLVIARPEPENQVDVVLDAYSRSARRARMVVVGDFGKTPHGRSLMGKYSDVEFVGALYDKDVLDALRRRSELYVHGHSVGGTNPSLIEAMAAGALIAAHDNEFNRWVTDGGSLFFSCSEDLVPLLDEPVLPQARASIVKKARGTCRERFLWSQVLSSYEAVIESLSAMD